MASVREETLRIPASLWAALKEVCYAQDLKFLQDVSRIIGVDANDIRRRVLGPLGEANILLVDSDPWWMGSMCALMELGPGGLWRRCNKMGESNSYCWDHRNFVNPTHKVKHHSDSYFMNVVKRKPARFNGEIVWVCDKGTVLAESGKIMPFTIDVRLGLARELVI